MKSYLISKDVVLNVRQILIITINPALRIRVRRTIRIWCDGTSGGTVDRWFFRAGRDRSSNIILRGCLQSISVRKRRHGFRGILRIHWSSSRSCVQQKQRLIPASSAFFHHLFPPWSNFFDGCVVKVNPYLRQNDTNFCYRSKKSLRNNIIYLYLRSKINILYTFHMYQYQRY